MVHKNCIYLFLVITDVQHLLDMRLLFISYDKMYSMYYECNNEIEKYGSGMNWVNHSCFKLVLNKALTFEYSKFGKSSVGSSCNTNIRCTELMVFACKLRIMKNSLTLAGIKKFTFQNFHCLIVRVNLSMNLVTSPNMIQIQTLMFD